MLWVYFLTLVINITIGLKQLSLRPVTMFKSTTRKYKVKVILNKVYSQVPIKITVPIKSSG